MTSHNSSIPRVLALADDLTGANDVMARFAMAGLDCLTIPHPEAVDFQALPQAQAVAINTRSRHIPAAEARERVQKLAEAALKAGIPFLYKKTDSTMRGNVGAELEGLHAAAKAQLSEPQPILFAPALPSAKRTVAEGMLFVEGTPVAQTAFSQDPLHPVRHSRIADLLGENGSIRTESVMLRALRSGTWMPAEDTPCYICDAETDEDLEAIFEAGLEAGFGRLWAGPAGISGPLAAHLAGENPRPAARLTGEGPLLVLNGSMAGQALKQVRYALDHGFAGHRVSPEEVIAEGVPNLDDVITALGEGRDLVIHTLLKLTELPRYFQAGEDAGLTARDFSRHLSTTLGGIGAELIRQCGGSLGGVVICGGETAQQVLDQLNDPPLRMIREVRLGVNAMRMQLQPGSTPDAADTGEPASTLNFITKSGAFAEPELFTEIKSCLKN
jgi:uncharacterized protein YgbK (DUF1537 family)